MTPEQLSPTFEGSPIKRAELRGLKRNAAVVLGNVGTAEDADALTAALEDPKPLVREHAAWALKSMGSPGALDNARAREPLEPDARVRDEQRLEASQRNRLWRTARPSGNLALALRPAPDLKRMSRREAPGLIRDARCRRIRPLEQVADGHRYRHKATTQGEIMVQPSTMSRGELDQPDAGPRLLDVPERYNVSLLLDANCDAGRGAHVAIYCGDERVTYRELLDRVCAMARALAALDVRRENRVLLILDDTPTFPVAFFGAIRLGAVPVPINPLYRASDYRALVEDSGARAVVTDHSYVAKVQEALNGYPEPVVLVVAGAPAPGAHALDDLLAAHRGESPPADTHRDDMAFWLYSSGSTGRPKGVVHLQHDIPYTCESYGRHVMRMTASDVVYARVLFHAYGLGSALSFPFAVGASAVLRPGRATPQTIVDTVQRFRPTVLCLVPTLYNAIVNAPEARHADWSSLRLCISAAEPLPPDTWQQWEGLCGLRILDGIGSTEMLHIFCSNTADALRPGSSGKAVPGYELRVLDTDGRVVNPGEVGDLWVKGDSAAAFYWRQHAKSKRTFAGEWVATGDRYRVDEDGFYWYEGRADDMIKIGGEWVSPIEIENALMAHPTVYEAAVVGVKEAGGLMRIKATVVLAADQRPSPELTHELQAWCKSRLQRYQYPHLVDAVDELPKTASGKIQRFKLRDAAE